MKTTKIYNATIMTSWYNRRGKKVGRNKRVKFEAEKDISYNEMERLAYEEFIKNPYNVGYEGVLWFN